MAISSIVLYSILFLSSILLLRRTYISADPKYRDIKLIFFSVLAVSAALDIPVWIGCALRGGTEDCEWHGDDHNTFWALHLFAICGYAFIIGVPPILWSDIITARGNSTALFTSRPSGIRLFFYAFSLLYLTMEVITIIALIVFLGKHPHKSDSDFTAKNNISHINCAIEAVIICCFAGGCLLSGIRLQYHVVRIGIHRTARRNFLIQLNAVLLVITLCYLARALFVFTLFKNGSRNYDIFLKVPFGFWILYTRWLPHVFCSLCLLLLMSRVGSHKIHSTTGYYITAKHANPAVQGSASGSTSDRRLSLLRESGLSYSDEAALSLCSNNLQSPLLWGDTASCSDEEDRVISLDRMVV